MRNASVSLAICVAVQTLGVASGVRADDEGLRLMAEPTSFTDVIDAFDGDDPFDLNATIAFERSVTSGMIQRETLGDGRTGSSVADIARHERVINRLMLGVDVGLYHDLALFARMPVVMSDARSLALPDGRSAEDVASNLRHESPDGSEQGLFDVPFTSPTRSGVDYIGVGLAWAFLNQFRNPASPTWVLIAEGQFAVGAPRRACFDVAPEGQARCNGGDDPGVSDGTSVLRLETRVSRRYRYVEPYAGLAFRIAWPVAAEGQFLPGGDLAGFMNTLPPREGELTAGATFVPWEHRGRFQRFSIDLRLKAAYVSEGHGFSPLFDALGTSANPYLSEPNRECPDASTCAREVPFQGLTDMQPHARYGARLAIEMQAAKYVRFAFGTEVALRSPYMISYSDACNPNVGTLAGDVRQGSCRSGIINPHHRPVIDMPGNRFRVQGELTLDLYASATAQF